jgi:hypothetical protein
MKNVKLFEDFINEGIVPPLLSINPDLMSLKATKDPKKPDEQIIYLTGPVKGKTEKLSYKVFPSYKNYASFNVKLKDLKRQNVKDKDGKISFGLSGKAQPTSWSMRKLLMPFVPDEYKVEDEEGDWLQFFLTKPNIDAAISTLRTKGGKEATLTADSGIQLKLVAV